MCQLISTVSISDFRGHRRGARGHFKASRAAVGEHGLGSVAIALVADTLGLQLFGPTTRVVAHLGV